MAEKGKVYRFMNPFRIQPALETYPLAVQLDTLDGKTLHFNVGCDPDITVLLQKRFTGGYWTSEQTRDIAPLRIEDGDMDTPDSGVLGVCR